MLDQYLEKAKTLKIAVIGDYIADHYIHGSVNRVSPEAPVVVLNQEKKFTLHGGAANVWQSLKNLGVDAYFFSLGDKRIVNENVFWHPAKCSAKTRVMSGSHHIVRIDEDPELDCIHYDDLLWREDIEKLLPELDAVVFADYHKGCIHPTLSHTIISKCNLKNIPVIVDAKKEYEKYRNATIVKMNKKEYENIDHSIYLEREAPDWLIVTMGEDGISARDTNGKSIEVGGINLDHIVDTCGAGDVVTSMIGLLKAQHLNMMDVISWANIAAAESCRYVGVHPITIEDLKNAKKS